MTENIYQSLRAHIPENPAAGDTRFTPFLRDLAVRKNTDADIECQVKRMQGRPREERSRVE